jgi:rhodanese-related sulfurtransferase
MLADAASRAEAICAAAGVAIVDASAAAAMAAEPGRTSYLLDIRSAEEAAADPVPAARHALSGQLVQATDQWVAVRGARLLLLDDAGLRGAVAAFWLKQMGFEPVVVRLGPPEGCPLRALPAAPGDVPGPRGAVSPQTALGMVRRGEAEFVDLRPSMTYRKGHVAGAVWGIRPRLAALAAKMGERRILLIADDEAVLALAQQELAGSGHEALPVTGGHDALAAAGAAVEATPHHPADQDCLDYLFFTHDRHDGNMEAARGYLSWEIELVDQLSPAERATFRLMDESAFWGGA